MKTKKLVSIAMFVAIITMATILGKFIPLFKMPQGGSIQIEYIIIIYVYWVYGLRTGNIITTISLLIGFMLEPPYYVSIPQFLLDYIIPVYLFCFVGLIKEAKMKWYGLVSLLFVLKYISHVTSGVLFFSSGGIIRKESIYFSLVYNFGYVFATALCVLLFTPLLRGRIAKIKK